MKYMILSFVLGIFMVLFPSSDVVSFPNCDRGGQPRPNLGVPAGNGVGKNACLCENFTARPVKGVQHVIPHDPPVICQTS